MMGYAHPEQVANGLHTRLYSRAYVIADNKLQSRVAFVAFDAGMTSQLVKLEVIKRLKEKHGNMFTEQNVVLSGSHTHSGPAGFFQYLLFEVTSLGHIEQSTEAFVNGIVESIEQANANLQPGTIKVGVGNVNEGNINRSPTSYLLNPESERNEYTHDTEQEMTVLRMEDLNGDPFGMVSWYPVHLTSMNFSNLLINSDNKGRASTLFEKQMRKAGETLGGKESFVGVFAQANLGDVSPRTNGPICIDSGRDCDDLTSTCGRFPRPDPTKCVGFGPGVDMFDSTDIIARRQLTTATDVFASASEEVTGSVGFIHQYVDMSKASVTLDDGSTVSTCKAGLGYSFAAGCTDGAGPPIFTQGTTNGTVFWDTIRDVIAQLVCKVQPTDEYYQCHRPKPVLLPTGYMDRPRPWHPEIVDVQMLKVGQLVIAAVPGEFSTMAGRRLRKTILNKAIEQGMPDNTKVVIAGLANVYTHYMTTNEEYEAQRYEAASTIFGPHTTRAYLQKFEELMGVWANGDVGSMDPGPSPEYSPQSQSPIAPRPAVDEVPAGVSFGDVMDDANATYVAGDVARVSFYGANPRHNMKLGSTYLEVQQKVTGLWKTIFTDADWETKFTWWEKNTTAPTDITLMDTLFDLIAHMTGKRFDIRKALEMEEKGEFPMTSGDGNEGLLKTMEQAGLLRNEPRVDSNSQKLSLSVESYVSIEWQIPEDAVGIYRIVYHGDSKAPGGRVTPFSGYSKEFMVEAPTGSGYSVENAGA
uniref:Neutral ceramidase n=1 Tax=Phallusia mammillata TaxID=59560 RepID=A0A6F9D669_9ASCI|nr:putative neutral ceramidase C [Phallusia mammillata]